MPISIPHSDPEVYDGLTILSLPNRGQAAQQLAQQAAEQGKNGQNNDNKGQNNDNKGQNNDNKGQNNDNKGQNKAARWARLSQRGIVV